MMTPVLYCGMDVQGQGEEPLRQDIVCGMELTLAYLYLGMDLLISGCEVALVRTGGCLLQTHLLLLL